MKSTSENSHCNEKKLVWLLILALTTLLLVFIGGLTRLTGSGLSMVSWNLIQGIIPPIGQSAWEETFAMYKMFPEYQKVNYNITLGEFKNIFYFEYFHRILGRIVGMITLLPILYFWWHKQLLKSEKIQFSFLFLLVCIQGLFGWWMVKSGLIDQPLVSHYRLAGHFFLALTFLTFITKLALGYLRQLAVDHPRFEQAFTASSNFENPAKNSNSGFYRWILSPPAINFVLTLFLLQLFYGTFTAGLDAGLVSSTYPLMFGQWFPTEALFSQPFPYFLLENPFFINFFHRHLGIIVSLLLLFLGVAAFIVSSKASSKVTLKPEIAFNPLSPLKIASVILIFLSLVQPALGILSLIYNIPIALASSHQIVAILLFICAYFIRWQLQIITKSTAK